MTTVPKRRATVVRGVSAGLGFAAGVGSAARVIGGRTGFWAALVALACAASAVGQAEGAGGVREDFEKAEVGPLPASLMIIDGGWVVAEAETGGKVLELQSEPVVDGVVLVGPSMKEAAVVSAKIKAGKSRRAHPRMGVGLYGVSGVKCRLVPARKTLELVNGEEEVVGEVAFAEWKEDVWWQFELRVSAAGDGWVAEARVWPAGGDRPAAPQLSKPLADGPGTGRASVLGTPFANKPVYFDDVVVGTTIGAP